MQIKLILVQIWLPYLSLTKNYVFIIFCLIESRHSGWSLVFVNTSRMFFIHLFYIGLCCFVHLLQEWVCQDCGGLLEPSLLPDGGCKLYTGQQPECLACGPSATVRQVSLPYALRYLVAELTCVGIRTQLGLRSAGEIIRRRQVQLTDRESLTEQPS